MDKNKGVLYVRVSTTKDEQKSSLEIQEQALEVICKSKNIEIIGTYSDKASGTRIRKRKGFISMLYDAGIDFSKRNDKSTDDFIINNNRSPKFNYIICKDIFRFGRNSSEAMQVIKELKNNGIVVYFVNAGFDTSDKDYKMRLELLFTIAENESHNTSQRIKFSKRHLAQQGKYTPSRLPYGYKRVLTTNGNKEIVIDKEQAEVVRFIYDRYSIDGGHIISNILNEKGIPTQLGKKWSNDKIHRIISNEAYYGSPIVQKWTKDDVTDIHFKKAKEVNRIQLFNVIPAIVTKEQFDELQKIKKERTNEKSLLGKKVGKDDIFYEKILCKQCGSRFVKHSGEKKKVMYMCYTRRKYTKTECDCKGIAYNVLVSYINHCEIKQTDYFAEQIVETLVERIDIVKLKIGSVEEEINKKINNLENEISVITRKFITASPEMEIELNKIMEENKVNLAKLIKQKEDMGNKEFDDLLLKIKNKKQLIKQLYGKKAYSFEEKMKMVDCIYVGSTDIEIVLNRIAYQEEFDTFNKLVEGTEFVVPCQTNIHMPYFFER